MKNFLFSVIAVTLTSFCGVAYGHGSHDHIGLTDSIIHVIEHNSGFVLMLGFVLIGCAIVRQRVIKMRNW